MDPLQTFQTLIKDDCIATLPTEIIIKILIDSRGIDAFNLLASCHDNYNLREYIKYPNPHLSFDYKLKKTEDNLKLLAYYGHVEPFENMGEVSGCYFYNACEGGHLDLTNLMISRGANYWNSGLQGACRGGHIDLANLMINKGATYWNLGLLGACRGGHIDLANLMINKGATYWDLGLSGSCKGGHLNLANLMIDKGATDWNWGLLGACEGGHIDLANLMIAKGATNWDFGLRDACRGGHIDLANLMIAKGATDGEYNCLCGHKKM